MAINKLNLKEAAGHDAIPHGHIWIGLFKNHMSTFGKIGFISWNFLLGLLTRYVAKITQVALTVK